METPPRRARRPARVAVIVGCIAALALAAVPTAGTSGLGTGLYAFVRADSPAPLPACAPDGTCTAANPVWHFVYVANLNPVTEIAAGPRTRATLRNAFVVTSVDFSTIIDGVRQPGPPFTFTPPPNAFFRSYSGHWPSTVTCPPGGDPCNQVTNPAVIAGEVTSVVFTGWAHGADEANGSHVFEYTVHGTLNGEPVSLTARSRPIVMTD